MHHVPCHPSTIYLSAFLFPCISFFLRKSKESINGTMFSLPPPSLPLTYNISLIVLAPLQCSFWTRWLMKQLSLNHWLWAFRLWVVNCTRSPRHRLYDTKNLPLINECLHEIALQYRWIRQYILWGPWYTITEFLKVVLFQRILSRIVRRIWSGCPCNRFSHWSINIWPMLMA